MRYQVLGTIEVDGVDPAGLRARKPRTLLAALLLRANAWVELPELVAAIWGESPPASAERNVTTYVWQLRKALPDGSCIDGRAGAYRIRVEPADLDAVVFEQECRAGAAALAEDRNADALGHLQRARALWRGRPYDALDTEAARVEGARLAEVHWEVRERLADALEACDRGTEAVALLSALTAEDPLRETPWCRLLVALVRAGRPADALAAYQRARDALIDELGVEPGPHLRRVHQRILADDEPDDGLNPGQRRLLARLPLVPGPALDAYAAAALMDSTPQAVAPLLAGLATAGAVRAGARGRYTLTRRPDVEPAAPGAEQAARDRLAAYYAHTALEAAGRIGGDVLRDVAATTPVPDFADVPAAAQWLADERDALIAAADEYARRGCVGPAWRIVRALQTQVDALGAPPQWAGLLCVVGKAARAAGDAQGELVLRNALGIHCWRVGQHDAALTELDRALQLAEIGADRRTVATMLLNLAEAHESLDRHAEAIDLLDRATALLQDLDCPGLSAVAADCRVRLHHAAVQRAGAGVLYRRWTHAVPPTGRLGA